MIVCCPATQYTVHFENSAAIQSADGQLALNCSVKAGCGDVSFTTGDGVDRTGPQISIEPIATDLLRSGTVVPVVVNFTDDNGVQKNSTFRR
jgi:hypothetical protein